MSDDWDSIVGSIGAQTGNTAVNNIAMQRRNPMLVARARRMAQDFGVGSPLIEADPQPFEEQAKRQAAAGLTDDHPWSALYFSQNPDVAAMVQSLDIPQIGKISTALGANRLATFGMNSPAQTVKSEFSQDISKMRGVQTSSPHIDFRKVMLANAARLVGVALPTVGLQLLQNDTRDRAQKFDEDVATSYKASGLTPLQFAGRAASAAGQAGFLGVVDVAHGALGVGELGTSLLTAGHDPLFNWYRQQDAIAAATEKMYTPEWLKGDPLQGAFSGIRSLTGMLTLAPLGAERALWGLSAETMGLSEAQFRNRGAGVLSSAAGALATGALEYATEKYMGGFGEGGIFTQGLHPSLHSFGEYIWKEQLGEQIATHTQDLVDFLVPGSSMKTWGDYWTQRWPAALQTFYAVTTMGAAVGATGAARNAFRKTVDNGADAVEGLHAQAMLDELMKNAQTSPLHKVSPEALGELIQNAAQSSGVPITHAYVPMEKIDEVLANENIPDEEKDALRYYQDQFAEARTSATGEVVIPVGEYVAKFAGTKTEAELRDDTRVLAGGLTAREAREHMDNLVKDLEAASTQAVDELKEVQPSLEAKRAVYEDVKAQLIKAGRPEREAQATAVLIASRAETLATARYGQFKDAGEAWKWMQLQIKGPEVKAARGGRKVAQSAFADPSTLLDRNDWAIMTAENPNAQQLPPEENAARNEELKSILDRMGLRYTPVRGKYGNEENSIAIEGITHEQAQDLGRRFGQESVLTHRGLVYGDNTVNPAQGVNILDKDAEDFFTELPSGIKFAVDINFDQRVPLHEEAARFNQSDLTPLEQVAASPGALEVAKSQRFPTIRDFKMKLQGMIKATKVGNLRDAKRVTRLALADARLALQNNTNAVGWYNEKVQSALEVFGLIHPEINEDEDARFAFIYALAVTSNGLKVDRNFKLADLVYREYKQTGKMPSRGEGTAQEVMQNSLKLFNTLKEKMGLPALRQFMLDTHTVGEIEKALGIPVTGEHKSTRVKGAAFLGPKIGNGFFSNLYGDFNQLTMDRWFIRTWGRWTGTLINEPSKTKVKQSRDRVLALMRALTPDQKRTVEKILSDSRTQFKIRLSDPDGFAQRVFSKTTSKAVRDALDGIDRRLRLDPKNHWTLIDGQKEAPQGPAERNEIRAIMVPVLKELQRDNPELTMADLQAVLWYPEKTLYDTAKAKAGAEAKIGYENEEAPDYANAAVALARDEGVDEEKINAALERARGRTSAAGRSGRAERSSGGSPARVAEDENGFPLEDVLSSQGDGQTDPTVYHQFGGQLAAQNDPALMSKLDQARTLEGSISDEQLYAETGWQRGPDGLWRFEIDDSKSKLIGLPSAEKLDVFETTPGIDYDWNDPTMRSGAKTIVVGARLSQVLDHPQLYRLYPFLADMPVFAMDLPENDGGYFDGRRIVYNDNQVDPAKIQSTLHHEIQHAIQLHEGFINGASAAADGLRALGLGDELDATVKYYEAIRAGEVPGRVFRKDMSDSDIRASAAFHVYERVAGENEARMVQSRLDYTPEERKEWMPNFRVTEYGHPVLLPENSNAFAQSTTGPATPRGETAFFPSGKTIISLFKADASTMLHELSHVFLEQEFRLAASKGASPELKADIEQLQKWFADNGANFNGTPEEKTAAHELFARTGERYFREGKAPSAELRGPFKQFREWMTGIYKQVKNLLAYGPAPINPEIREIFDRIIATDEAIAANSTTPMSQEELGMTSAEYEAYLGSVSNAHDAAYDALLNKMMKSIRQRDNKEIAAQRANVREEVAKTVNSDPRFVALHLLRTNRWLNDPNRAAPNPPIKINTGWLIDNFGEDVLKQLPVGLQPIHRGDGVDGDTVAEMVGMKSGDALVKSLLDLKRQADALKAAGNPRPLRDQIIEDQTNKIMADRHGDIAMSEADVRDEAIGALNSNRQGEVLATELRQLKKKANRSGVVTPYQILREWARRKANEGTVADAVSKETLRRYTRLYNRARNAFEAAILKGDTDEAIKQKQAQLINHALLAEGKKVADDIDAVVRRMQRYAKTKAMASIDQDYMDRVHELLEGYNFRTVSDVSRAEKASFEEWAAKQREQGQEVYVPARFRDDRVNWKDAQVSKLLELNDMVESLVALGKLKQKMIVAGEERRLDEMRDEAEASILQLPERNLGDASTGETTKPFRQRMSEAKTFADYAKAVLTTFRPGHRVREYAAGLVKIEGVADLLDQTKMGTGVLNRVLIRGATDAANNYSTLKEEVMDGIAAAYHAMSGKLAARLNNLVTIPELTLNAGLHETDPRRGQPLNITRRQLLALVANTGNLSNLSKLVGGERWGDPESMVDMTRVQQTLISYLDKEEMDFVQSLWDGMGKLWPHVARVEREMTGVVPEAVTPMDVETPWGTYHGGYWPVVWDADRTDMGKPDEEKSEANMFGVGTGLGTYKGHTITRTGAMAPMDWSLERVLFARTNQIISRITYAPWIRDSLKLLNSSRVSGAIRLRLGNEYLGAIKSWMRDQIPSNMQDISGAKAWEKVLTAMRINMTATVLGLSYSTGIAQVQGLTYSAGVLGEGNMLAGPKWIAAGFQRMIQLQMPGQPGAQEFVFGRSEEMRRRAHELNREVRDVFDRLAKGEGNRLQRGQRKLQAMAFWHIAFIDLNTVSIPTWLGGYEKAKAQGLSEADAAAYADKTVRLSQGSGREKDMSAIQRGGAGQRFISMFYTPSSVFFNAQWEAAQEMKAGNWSKALAPTFWFLMANTLMDAMRNGDWPPDDEDGNITPESFGKWISRNLFFGMFYGVPVLRDIANTANRKLRGQYADWGSTPLSYGLQAIGKGLTAGYKQVTGQADEANAGRDLKNEATAVGFVLGLPGNQIGRTGGFITDVAKGKEHPETIEDWFTGLTSGSAAKSSGSKK